MRGRKKGTKVERKKKPYFAETEELAVIYFIDPQTPNQMRNRIYETYLYKPLRKLTEGVSKRYAPYSGLLGQEELEEAAFIALFDVMHKFRPYRLNTAGDVCKAYSYYGTIVRNWCSNFCEKTYDKENSHSTIEEVFDQFDSDLRFSYEIEDEDEDEKNPFETLMKSITANVRKEIATNEDLKVNDMKVGEAIIAIFENWSAIYAEESKNFDEKRKLTPYFLRKKINQIMKDFTGLQSKDIKKSMKVYKSLYHFLLDEQLKDDDESAHD